MSQGEFDFSQNPIDPDDVRFDGDTYDHERDAVRLGEQTQKVYWLMQDGHWRTLQQIADATGAPEASVSARLRDLRKLRFGKHEVMRRYIARGLFEYRLVL